MKLISLPMSSIMCMQNVVDSSSKPDVCIFLLKSTSFACLPHCHEAECHGTPQSGTWIYFLNSSLCLLGDLPRNYNLTCFSGDTLRADSFLEHRIFHALLCQATSSKGHFSKESRQREFTRFRVAELCIHLLSPVVVRLKQYFFI